MRLFPSGMMFFLIALILSIAFYINCGDTKKCNYDENEAKELAMQKIESDSLNWGNPLYMNYNKPYFNYTFVYSTPDSEIILLGHRGIEVDCITGNVKYLQRH